MTDLVLFGAGGLARETVQFIVNNLPEYRLLGFVVDEQYYTGSTTVITYKGGGAASVRV